MFPTSLPWSVWPLFPGSVNLGQLNVTGMQGSTVQLGANVQGCVGGASGPQITLVTATGDFSNASVRFAQVISTSGGLGGSRGGGQGGVQSSGKSCRGKGTTWVKSCEVTRGNKRRRR